MAKVLCRIDKTTRGGRRNRHGRNHPVGHLQFPPTLRGGVSVSRRRHSDRARDWGFGGEDTKPRQIASGSGHDAFETTRCRMNPHDAKSLGFSRWRLWRARPATGATFNLCGEPVGQHPSRDPLRFGVPLRHHGDASGRHRRSRDPAQGVLRTAIPRWPRPPTSMLSGTRSRFRSAWPRAGSKSLIQFDLADILPNWPYKWLGIDHYKTEVTKVIKAKIASGRDNFEGYEIWNEPDGTWNNSNGPAHHDGVETHVRPDPVPGPEGEDHRAVDLVLPGSPT
jgi:hypothetical protein